MRADRRTVLMGSAMLAAVPVIGELGDGTSRLIVFDSGVPESLAFASGRTGHRLDLTHAHASRWSELRLARPHVDAVDGLTGWSDWVGLRGELEAQGFRLKREERVGAPVSGKSHLFRWSMDRG